MKNFSTISRSGIFYYCLILTFSGGLSICLKKISWHITLETFSNEIAITAAAGVTYISDNNMDIKTQWQPSRKAKTIFRKENLISRGVNASFLPHPKFFYDFSESNSTKVVPLFNFENGQAI